MEKINIGNFICKWFDMKYSAYDKLEDEDSIYLYYEGEKYADIRIDKKDGEILYNWKYYKELSEIISVQIHEFEGIMSKWVESTFYLKELTPQYCPIKNMEGLKIPK